MRLWLTDVDGSGVLEKNELNNMLSSIGDALTHADLNQFWSLVGRWSFTVPRSTPG